MTGKKAGWSVLGISVGAACIASSVAIARVQAAQPEARIWSFEDDSVNGLPSGFSFSRTGEGRLGKWLVTAAQDAPSGANVLAQVDEDATDFRFPLAVADEPLLRNFRLSVKCKPVSGAVDQACGVVFRYQDVNNYYVTRANALEENVRLYHVVEGRRGQFAGWNGTVKTGVWQELKVEVRDNHLLVFWDGKKVIDAHDETFAQAGKVGVWTKSDSITYFDALTVEPLKP